MSWKTVKLGEVCEISIGKTPPRKDIRYWDRDKTSGNVWVSIADLSALSGLGISNSKEYISDQGAKLFRPVNPGTLLMSFKLSIGRLAFAEKELRTNEAIAALPVKDSDVLSNRYLRYYLSSQNWDRIAGDDIKIKGKTLNKAKLKELNVLLPPLAEQERIVAKLDAAFAAIDQGIALAEKKEAEVEHLKAALLSASLAGDDWKTVKLGEVCEISNGGTPKSKVSEYWGEEIQWLTPKDMGKLNGRDVFQTERQISRLGLENSSAKLIPQDSIILSCRAPIGHIAINKVPMSFNQGCKGLVPSDSLSLEYLYFFLFSSKQLLNDLGTGTTFKEISGKTLSSVSFPLPPLAEQERIVAKLDAAFAELEAACTAIAESKANYQALKAAILAQELQPKENAAA